MMPNPSDREPADDLRGPLDTRPPTRRPRRAIAERLRRRHTLGAAEYLSGSPARLDPPA